jgi:hypothetical protein
MSDKTYKGELEPRTAATTIYLGTAVLTFKICLTSTDSNSHVKILVDDKPSFILTAHNTVAYVSGNDIRLENEGRSLQRFSFSRVEPEKKQARSGSQVPADYLYY